MSLIIGNRIKLSALSKTPFKDMTRPCGMNSILFMNNRYPSRKEIEHSIGLLKDDECFIVFDAFDCAHSLHMKPLSSRSK